jgi:hypothetical protein
MKTYPLDSRRSIKAASARLRAMRHETPKVRPGFLFKMGPARVSLQSSVALATGRWTRPADSRQTMAESPASGNEKPPF